MRQQIKYHRLILLLVAGIISLNNLLAQDIHFSQFYEAPLLRNPSLAGIFTGDVRVQAVYRDQWNSITNAYKTGSLNAEYKMPVGKGDDFMTVGLQMLYDKAGTVGWTSTHALPALNFHKSLSTTTNRYLSLGFMAGAVQRSIDRTKIITDNTYNNGSDGETFPQNSYMFFDGAIGMTFNTQLNDNIDNNMFVGFAYHHLNRPKNSFYRNAAIELSPKMVASAGIKFSVTPQSYLTIQADHSMQGDFRETVMGALYGLKLQEDEKPKYVVHGGAFIRWNDAVIPALKIDYTPFSISMSYDINISRLKTSSYGRGGFEVGISYVGFLDRESPAAQAVWCPRF